VERSFDADAFAALQARLAPMWPALTIRRRDDERTLVVVSSIHFRLLPEHIRPLLPAYEERYLFYVLSLARAPRTRVIYVTSQPILPRMLEYYLGLIPGVDRDELRSRLVPVSVGDWSPRPLTQKILDRPRLVARLRSLIPDPSRAVLLPFATTEAEAQLAVELGIPVYGPHPDLAALGTKTGSRATFAAAGVPHPRGSDHIRTPEQLVDAVEALTKQDAPEEAIVKLDTLGSGLGNAVVDLRGANDRRELARRIPRLRPEDDSLDAAAFLDLLATDGGIVEERICGADLRSPSVQLRASPEGRVEVMSTHDQLLGGPTGQSYFGCRFPADPAYARWSLAVWRCWLADV
jgi:Pre ATP-grasp domain